MQAMGDMQGDLRSCKADFKNFTAAFGVMHGGSIGGGDFHFNTDTKSLHAGIKDIGYGLEDVSKGVGDCHLAELAELLSKLAIKLGVVPEICWVEEVLHILIEGVHVEQELGAAMVDYGNNNWVGFGYNPAKLINQDTRLNVLQCLLLCRGSIGLLARGRRGTTGGPGLNHAA